MHQETKTGDAHGDGLLSSPRLRATQGSNIVKLDVGGYHFTTSIQTLISHPESMLSAMFRDGQMPSSSVDGRVFIDRDGEHFGVILNYLRDRAIPPGVSADVRRKLSAEAHFYGLHELEQWADMAEQSEFEKAADSLSGAVRETRELVVVTADRCTAQLSTAVTEAHDQLFNALESIRLSFAAIERLPSLVKSVYLRSCGFLMGLLWRATLACGIAYLTFIFWAPFLDHFTPDATWGYGSEVQGKAIYLDVGGVHLSTTAETLQGSADRMSGALYCMGAQPSTLRSISSCLFAPPVNCWEDLADQRQPAVPARKRTSKGLRLVGKTRQSEIFTWSATGYISIRRLGPRFCILNSSDDIFPVGAFIMSLQPLTAAASVENDAGVTRVHSSGLHSERVYLFREEPMKYDDQFWVNVSHCKVDCAISVCWMHEATQPSLSWLYQASTEHIIWRQSIKDSPVASVLVSCHDGFWQIELVTEAGVHKVFEGDRDELCVNLVPVLVLHSTPIASLGGSWKVPWIPPLLETDLHSFDVVDLLNWMSVFSMQVGLDFTPANFFGERPKRKRKELRVYSNADNCLNQAYHAMSTCACLGRSFLQGKDGRIIIDEPVHAFKWILDYLRGGAIPSNIEDAHQLCQEAFRFDIPALVSRCQGMVLNASSYLAAISSSLARSSGLATSHTQQLWRLDLALDLHASHTSRAVNSFCTFIPMVLLFILFVFSCICIACVCKYAPRWSWYAAAVLGASIRIFAFVWLDDGRFQKLKRVALQCVASYFNSELPEMLHNVGVVFHVLNENEVSNPLLDSFAFHSGLHGLTQLWTMTNGELLMLTCACAYLRCYFSFVQHVSGFLDRLRTLRVRSKIMIAMVVMSFCLTQGISSMLVRFAFHSLLILMFFLSPLYVLFFIAVTWLQLAADLWAWFLMHYPHDLDNPWATIVDLCDSCTSRNQYQTWFPWIGWECEQLWHEFLSDRDRFGVGYGNFYVASV